MIPRLFLSSVDVVVVVVDSHIQRIVLATGETMVIQEVSHRPIKCQSRSCSERGTNVKGSHHGERPLLKPTGVQIATKPLPDPTNREHRKLIGVKTMPLGTNFHFYCCIWRRLSDVMCCPTNKVIRNYRKGFLARGRLHEDKLWDTLQALAPTNVKTVQ